MSLFSRIVNALRADRLNRELDEEFESHIAEAIAEGRDPAEARRAFGSPLRQREASRQHRVAGWLDGLRADMIFGWRQLKRNKLTSGAAVLSLALAMGACVSAFRLIDALLLRPLPIAEPQRLFAISFSGFTLKGEPHTWDSCSYPLFRKMRAAVRGKAELIAVSYAERQDLTYGSDDQMEKAVGQWVSGWIFDSFGIQPAVGRLLTANDDLEPGKNPVAVLSYDYWMRRFIGDPNILGHTLRMGRDTYEIVGVAGKGFTGTEPGVITDFFVPMMMKGRAIDQPNSFWFRSLLRVNPGIDTRPLRDQLFAVYRASELERSNGFKNMPRQVIENSLQVRLEVRPAAAGVSSMQKEYREALLSLGVLVGLVLLIACANVANLMTVLAAARTREMALRVSIGAGRWRLVQMVLVESAMIALLAAGLGTLFAWWSAPLVVRLINSSDNSIRLILPADLRVLSFNILLIVGVTLLFGLLPALRASSVRPVHVLKGGGNPRARRQLMRGMIVAQVAFCFLVVFMGSMFVASFRQLNHVPLGFSPERVVTLDTIASQPLPPAAWQQLADRQREVPGVERVALAGWPLMSGTQHNNFISVHGAPPNDVLAFFLRTSPDWLETMKVPLLQGRTFRDGDADPGPVLVNSTFAKQFFPGENPIGQSFNIGGPLQLQIVGVVGDVTYNDIREPIVPQVYVPFPQKDAKGVLQPIDETTILVRTASENPPGLDSLLRQVVHRARSEFRVSNIRTQREIIDAQTVRERLLAMLGMFFAAVALLLAGIGLYGVLNYSVLQRQREIGIRVALGARRNAIARLITEDVFLRVSLGAFAGVLLGLGLARYIETLFYQVKASDATMLTAPCIAIVGVALLATAPAVARALRIDPAEILRSE
jgi:putative ABC transport system permease protein